VHGARLDGLRGIGVSGNPSNCLTDRVISECVPSKIKRPIETTWQSRVGSAIAAGEISNARVERWLAICGRGSAGNRDDMEKYPQ